MSENLYSERDNEAQGHHYLRHVDRMTTEKLHSKSAIAGELAHRDAEIAALRDALESLLESFTNSECGEVDRKLAVKDARIALAQT